MIRTSRIRALLLALLLLTLWAGAGHADYRAGVEAYRAGDFERALREWRSIAEQAPGEVEPGVRAETSYALAMLYWLGQGVVQDSARAAGWLQQAADLNHAGAQSKLGYLYLIGQGVPQSDFEAFKWLSMAANRNDVDAQYNLGVMYRDGRAVPASPERALQWFSEAAANGDVASAGIIEEYQRSGVLVADTGAASPPGPQPEEPPPVRPNAPETAGGNSLAQRIATFRKEQAQQSAPATVPADWPAGVGREDWIAARNPGHYAIQVIAVRRTDAVRAFIAAHPEWLPFAVFRQGPADAPLWVVVQGDYATLEEVRAARDRFPTDIQVRENLWIRQFAAVQRLLQ